MTYKQYLLDEIDRKIAEIHEIALSYRDMAAANREFLELSSSPTVKLSRPEARPAVLGKAA